MKQKSRVLFLCKDRTTFYGNNNSIGLINSSTFVINYLKDINIESKLEVVIDANSIDKEMFQYKPTHVIIEALWVTPEKLEELINIKRYSNVKWIIRIHSKIPFLANEGIAFDWIVKYTKLMEKYKNLFISPNSPELVDDLINIFKTRTIYLPNIYYPKDQTSIVKKVKKDYIDIGCLGAIRPMKNILIQAVAAIEYGNKINKAIHFHINADRVEQSGENVYKNLKALFEGTSNHKLIEEPWKSHSDFINLVKTLDIGLQVSLSETFNIVAADFIANEIPLIGSTDITWLPGIFKANPNSSEDIVNKIKLIMNMRFLKAYNINKIYLNNYNNDSKKIWKTYLS